MDKITLDREVFKALASDTRLDILKALDERQKTVTELARELNLNKATVFEHLEKLVQVGLVNKLEDERKWVYYQLSWTGRRLLHPEKITIALLLSSALASLVTAAAALWAYVARRGAPGPGSGGGGFEDATGPSIAYAPESSGSPESPGASDNFEKVADGVADAFTAEPALLGVAVALGLLVLTFLGLALVVWRRARRASASDGAAA